MHGLVTIRPQSHTARLTVQPKDLGGSETFRVRLAAGPGYTVREPRAVHVKIHSRYGGSECAAPTLRDAEAWSNQAIVVGGQPTPLLVDPAPGGVVLAYLEDGQLPPGLTIASSGTFLGAATQPGHYDAVVGACTPAMISVPPPRTGPMCVTKPLHVDVRTPDAAAPDTMVDDPPRTDASVSEHDDRPCSNISAATIAPGELAVERTGSTDAPLTVAYVAGGTAIADGGVEPLPGSVTFSAGSSVASIQVVPLARHIPAPVHVQRASVVTLTLIDDDGFAVVAPASAQILLHIDFDVFGCDQPVSAASQPQ